MGRKLKEAGGPSCRDADLTSVRREGRKREKRKKRGEGRLCRKKSRSWAAVQFQANLSKSGRSLGQSRAMPLPVPGVCLSPRAEPGHRGSRDGGGDTGPLLLQ